MNTTPDNKPAPCVCCGEPGQIGRYDGMPVCFPCYYTGLLKEWLEQQAKAKEDKH